MSKALLADGFGLTDLADYFEQEPEIDRGIAMPVPYVNTPERTFYTDARERKRYKLGRDGAPLPMDLEPRSGSDYDEGLSAAEELTNDEDAGFTLSDFLNTF